MSLAWVLFLRLLRMSGLRVPRGGRPMEMGAATTGSLAVVGSSSEELLYGSLGIWLMASSTSLGSAKTDMPLRSTGIE